MACWPRKTKQVEFAFANLVAMLVGHVALDIADILTSLDHTRLSLW